MSTECIKWIKFLHQLCKSKMWKTCMCSYYELPWNTVSLLVGCLTSQQHASVSQGRICSDNFMCCHTEIEVADQTFSVSPSHSILTPGWPVPALTLYHQTPGRVATGVPIFKLLVWLDPEKSPRKQDLDKGSSALEADVLSTRPTRRSLEHRQLWITPDAQATSHCITAAWCFTSMLSLRYTFMLLGHC